MVEISEKRVVPRDIRDRSEFEALREKTPTQHKSAHQTQLAMRLIHMSTAMGSVLESPEWQEYLNVIEGIKKQWIAVKDAVKEELLGDTVVNADELNKLKLRYARADASIQTISELVKIPQHIMEGRGQLDLNMDTD